LTWEADYLSPHRPFQELAGGFLTETAKGNRIVRDGCLRRGHVGEPEEGVHLYTTMSDSEGVLMKWCVSFSRALLCEPGEEGFFVECTKRYEEEGSGDGHISLLGGPAGELGMVLICQDLCMSFWRQVSLHGGPMDHLVRGMFTRNSERSLKGGSGGSLSVSAL
jgi:hypothetical protein